MWHAVRWTVIATLLGCWALPGMAADSPAQLFVGEDSIEELLRLPRDLEPGRYTVHCETSILRNGDPWSVYCYTMQAPVPANLVKAVISAVNRAKFVPAVHKEARIDVYAVLMVLIDTTFAEPMVLAVPNNGADRQRYGLLYTAPQRVLTKEWRERRSGRMSSGKRPDLLVWMRFHIDEDGGVRDFRLDELNGASPGIMFNLNRYVRQMKFLPGYYEGRPTSMLYLEPYFAG